MTDAEPKPASSAARIPLTEIVASKTNPRIRVRVRVRGRVMSDGIMSDGIIRMPTCRATKPAKYVWTPERDEILRANYDSRVRGRVRALAARLSFPGWAIRVRATVLGLTRMSPRARAWTPEEDAVLDKWAGRRSVKWIADRLPGRTLTAVVGRFKRREISRAIEGYTARSLAFAMGVDNRIVNRWVREGLLKPNQRGVMREAHWNFTHGAVRTFVRNNPTAFRLDKVDQVWFMDLAFGDSGFREREVAA